MLIDVIEKFDYNRSVDPRRSYPEEFFIAISTLKGAVCRCGYSSEKLCWVNQTVPLS